MTRNSDAQCPGTKRQIAQECVRLGWIAAHFRLSDQLDGPFRSQRARPQRLSTAKLQAYFVSQSNGDLLPQLSMRSWLHPRALKTCLQLTARHLELHFPLVHSKHSQHCRHPERFRFEGSRERFITPRVYRGFALLSRNQIGGRERARPFEEPITPPLRGSRRSRAGP